jgi:preprotein translocase SecE subunit
MEWESNGELDAGGEGETEERSRSASAGDRYQVSMKLEFYKKGQGYYTRMGTAIGSGVIVALGCWSLYDRLDGVTTVEELRGLLQGCAAVAAMIIANFIFFKKVRETGQRVTFLILSVVVLSVAAWFELHYAATMVGGIVTVEPLKTWVRAIIPAVVFLGIAWVVYRVLNTPRYADFMIDTEGEMKKVSWSTKKEIITSTKVVISTVILMAVLLVVVDIVFSGLLTKVGVLKNVAIGD